MPWEPPLEIVTEERHRFFLREAYLFAARASDDPTTKVGAVLVQELPSRYQLVAQGANHVPRDIDVDPQALLELLKDRAWKAAHMRHAEPTVIARAQEQGHDPAGMTMYMPWVPCTPCATRMIEAGVAELVAHEAMVRKTPERWWASTEEGIRQLVAEGIRCRMYRGEIGGVTSTFNGEVWTP